MNDTDRTGTLTLDGDNATITFVRRLPHPIDVVWSALTEPDQRAVWFGPTTIEGRVGGVIDMIPQGPPVSPGDRHMTGRILVWEPPRVLEHEWRQAIVAESVVRYELTADGEDTVLTFTHRGLRASDGGGFIPGTHAYFDRLQAHLDGTPLPNWNRRRIALQPLYS
jgi:uncharacterized protein YndB with AHSA1/START domain